MKTSFALKTQIAISFSITEIVYCIRFFYFFLITVPMYFFKVAYKTFKTIRLNIGESQYVENL
jgi:hypothetical protein